MDKEPAPLRVSDHAVLRWLQRSGLVDVDFFREALGQALARAGKATASIGSNNYLIVAEGLVFVVREQTVVTVLHDRGRYQRACNAPQLITEDEQD